MTGDALSVADLAYIAGLLDANATISTRETVAGSLIPKLQVNGGPVEVLRWLGTLTEVKVVPTRRSYSRAPCAVHCRERHQHIVSESARWTVDGAKATVVLAAVLPYMRQRRQIAEEAVRMGLAAHRKAATVKKMARAGWPVPAGMDGPPEPTRRRRGT